LGKQVKGLTVKTLDAVMPQPGKYFRHGLQVWQEPTTIMTRKT
jgi:hypothetical protein